MQKYKNTFGAGILGLIGIFTCVVLRVLPFRPPNIEPIMAMQLPFAKRFGALSGFLFGLLSIVLYDFATGTVGPWTLITAPTYGIVGWCATLLLRHMPNRRQWLWYGGYAFGATIFYDAVTGLLMGPILFHQSLTVAIMGQIPFTFMHLAGNVPMAMLFSPAIAYGIKQLLITQPEKIYAHQ